MVLPDFCELGLDLELSEDADDAAGAGSVAAAPVTPGDGEPEPLVEELEPLAARHGLHGQLEADPVASPALPGGEADEESQSHYDLGIAYKEMGMLAEAVAEFTAAARDTSRSVDCLTLMAQCRLQMGDAAAAEATFKEALAQPGLTDDALVALRYELGLLYDVAGRPLEALESYQDVADRAPQFRDVAKKLKSLRRSLGLDEQPDPPPASRAGRDRISYV
jgi:tetratricopeptide (TPR) repeat protein